MSPDLVSRIECTIKDVSDGGALVATGDGVHVPDRVYLWQAETGATIECQVRWRRPGVAGLKFSDLNAPAVRALSRICTPMSQRVLRLHAPRRSVMVSSPAAAARFLAELA